MGQKVHPTGQRIGIIYTWPSKWYAKKKEYSKLLHEDIKLVEAIEKELIDASVSHVEIQRTAGNVMLLIHSAKPGLIIGRQGENIAGLRDKFNLRFKGHFNINIREIKKPDINAKLVARNITKQIEKRVSYRRAAKMAISRAMENGALGAKVLMSGRLNGVEISRSEYFLEGKIPLHTFRADIDFAYVPAQTKYGVIGVKVWIYKGEIFKKIKEKQKHVKEIPIEITEEKEFLPK